MAAAARRCAFLEAYPEHACAEQSSMMKAFMRRNYSAVEIARAEAIAQRASAWEEVVSKKSSGDSAREERGGDASPVSFRRAYTAYLSRIEKAARAGYVPDEMKYPPSPKKDIKRDKAAKASESDCRSRERRGNEAFRERMFDCLATAWGKHNRQRVAAQRFADAHDPSGSSDHRAVALVAVTALVLVPMLMEKTELMCHCDINPVERDAEDWKALNCAEFNKALEGVNARLEAGIRALEGCECDSEENIVICSLQVLMCLYCFLKHLLVILGCRQRSTPHRYVHLLNCTSRRTPTLAYDYFYASRMDPTQGGSSIASFIKTSEKTRQRGHTLSTLSLMTS